MFTNLKPWTPILKITPATVSKYPDNKIESMDTSKTQQDNLIIQESFNQFRNKMCN